MIQKPDGSPASLPGRLIFSLTFRWFHHRLPSTAPPAQRNRQIQSLFSERTTSAINSLTRLFLLSCALSLSCVQAFGQDAAADKPLKLEQVEQLLTIGWDDAVLAREMLKRGIAFRADAKAIERLSKKKLGAQTRAALSQLDTRAAFQEIQNTKDPNARLSLSRQFLQQYAGGEFAAQAKDLARAAERDVFDQAYQSYLTAPDLPKLTALFTRGDELRVREPDAVTALHLIVRLARAAGRGIYENFYTDLERSRSLANNALQQLDQATDEAAQKLRTENAPALAQLLALYHLRQTPADTAAALKLLERALAPDTLTAKDPVTYWLRALINREQYQKLRAEYAALSPEARTSSTIICQQFAALTNHLIEDYTKVVELGGAANVRQVGTLRDEAVAAVKTISQTPSPCAVPATPPAQRARRVANNAPRTLFIRSKTVYLKQQQLETALLKDTGFQALNWRIVRNEKEADVIAEVTLPFLTWQWTIEVTQPATSVLVGTVQIRENVARNALPKLLPLLVDVFKQARF